MAGAARRQSQSLHCASGSSLPTYRPVGRTAHSNYTITHSNYTITHSNCTITH